MAAEPKPKSQRWTLSTLVEALGTTRDACDKAPAVFSAQTNLFKDMLLERRCADLLDYNDALYPIANSKMATERLAQAYKQTGLGASAAMIEAVADKKMLNTFLDTHMGKQIQ